MSQLNKSTVGLGKVINRLQSDGNDLAILVSRLQEVEMNNFISGNWDTIVNNPKVNLVAQDTYEIDLDNNLGVAILLNYDGKKIKLKGGMNGRAFYFTFSNIDSYMVFWDNVRITDGETPFIYAGTPTIPRITTITIVRVGNEYYLTNVNLNVV